MNIDSLVMITHYVLNNSEDRFFRSKDFPISSYLLPVSVTHHVGKQGLWTIWLFRCLLTDPSATPLPFVGSCKAVADLQDVDK